MSYSRLITTNFHPPYGYKSASFLSLEICLHLNCLALGYSYATCKSYTQISLLHGKGDYWYFEGLTTAPPVVALTSIQRLVLTIASITLPTHTLLLIAVTEAPQRRFGVPPSPILTSRLIPQTSIHKYPCFVRPDLFTAPQQTGLVHLH